jgi:hypothetical protein
MNAIIKIDKRELENKETILRELASQSMALQMESDQYLCFANSRNIVTILYVLKDNGIYYSIQTNS